MSSSHTITLAIPTAQSLKNLAVLAHKSQKLDPQALLRIRRMSTVGDTSPNCRVWSTTPFGPIGCRTMSVRATCDNSVLDDAVVSATNVADAAIAARATDNDASNDASNETHIVAGSSHAASWPGALPPEDGWQLVDYVPALVFRKLEKQGRIETRQAGPLGMPPSLLDQVVVEVQPRATASSSARNDETTIASTSAAATSATSAEITMRDVFALCGLGFIPPESDISEPVRVSTKGRWHRLDGRFGSIYTSKGFGVIAL